MPQRRDYRANSQLDVYEDVGLEEEVEEVLDHADLAAARRAAEAELDRRDKRAGVRGGRKLPTALAGKRARAHTHTHTHTHTACSLLLLATQ